MILVVRERRTVPITADIALMAYVVTAAVIKALEDVVTAAVIITLEDVVMAAVIIALKNYSYGCRIRRHCLKSFSYVNL